MKVLLFRMRISKEKSKKSRQNIFRFLRKSFIFLITDKRAQTECRNKPNIETDRLELEKNTDKQKELKELHLKERHSNEFRLLT